MSKKRGGKWQTLVICQHTKKSYFHTGNWNISHIHVHLDIFIRTEMTFSDEYLWGRWCKQWEQHFCYLWHNLKTDGLQSDCCQQSAPSLVVPFSHPQLCFTLDDMLFVCLASVLTRYNQGWIHPHLCLCCENGFILPNMNQFPAVVIIYVN